jgi:cysteine dioxygenase
MSNFIYSIESLYNTIDCKYKASAYFIDLTHIVKNYIGDDWRQYINFNNNTYNRIRLNDFSNSKFEMYIISWKPDQMSPVHDHSDNGCIMKVLDGSLKEILYDYNLTPMNDTIINKNYVSFIDNHIGLHKIEALDYSVSLHIYSPPNYISLKF